MHPRRPAHHSVYRRRASPRGERATPPVRPPKRVPALRLPARGACTSAGSPITACAGARLPARGACNSAGPPTTACTDAAPPRKGSVQLRRFAYPRCAGAAPPARERAPMPVRPPQRDRLRVYGAAPPREGSVHLRRTTRLSVCRRAPLRKGSVRPRRPALPGAGRRTRAKAELRPKPAALGLAPRSRGLG